MNTCVNATFIMPDITKLAKERSNSTEEPFMLWHDALSKGIELAEEARIDPDAFLMLTHNCKHSTQFLSIIEALNEHAKENLYGANAFNLLNCFVENSPYKLTDWIDGLEYFCDWLRYQTRQAPLIMMLNYTAECIESMFKAQTNPTALKNLIEKALRTYGL